MEASSEVLPQGHLERAKAVYSRLYGSVIMITSSMILANTSAGNEFVVRADNPILEQAERSLPSALVAPNMGDYNKAVGVGSQIALTSIGADCALKTSTPGEMFGTAVAAQLASSGADSLVERTTNWLSHAERTQEDVGASAIYLAWIFKFMLDRERTSESHKLSWRLGMTALTGAAVVVIPLAESSQGGKLDAVAHGVSLVVAYGAHRFGLRKRSNGGELYLERAGA